MKLADCNYIQGLIDKGTEKPLGFFEDLRVRIHIAMCVTCREYKKRTNLFSKVLFTSNKNEKRINSYQEAILHKSKSVQNRLASFPEQNPSPIVELEKSGKISYQNPAFFKHFPHVSALSVDHQFFEQLVLNFNALIDGTIKEFSKEFFYNHVHYIQRASYLAELSVVRVFYLDITEQKTFEKIIYEKNLEITQSIQYALRIQEAILPSQYLFKEIFPESFVLYKPKDVVAGDFYWLNRVDDWVFAAAADCTGHGVPGALVSVVCNNALNRSVKEFKLRDTGLILDKTREIVIETFANSDSDVKDGMDISIVGIKKSSAEVCWSGANNPLWYLSKNQLMEVAANKQPIGKTENPLPFRTHKIRLDEADYLFLFTDGYADQFGGENEKKFKYKQLQNLLLENSEKSPEELKNVLDARICSWKGELEQTDDILVVGIKL
ncbi:MAG: SpoIIE family protein phosphatase [bacterium]|nr:SpoIIE family protein phosphatase [bacterium]